MRGKSTVVVVKKKKKNYIYSKIPRFQRFAGTSGKVRKTPLSAVLWDIALADTVKLSQIFFATSFVLLKNWNFGISTGYT